MTVVSVFALDQITKYLIIFKMEVGDRIEILPIFNIVHYKNKGAAFGMFHDSSPTFRLVFFGLVTIACVFYLVWSLATTPEADKFYRFIIALILGGALGNVKDRMIFQQVTDFLDFHWGIEHFPAFNVADMAITSGVSLMILQYLIAHSRHRRKKR